MDQENINLVTIILISLSFIFIFRDIVRIFILQKRLSLNLIYKATISLVKFKNKILRLTQFRATVEKNSFY